MKTHQIAYADISTFCVTVAWVAERIAAIREFHDAKPEALHWPVVKQTRRGEKRCEVDFDELRSP